MAERPTLDTVAAEAGVSRMTVSNAYNRPDQLSAATRERVLEVARRLGYPGPDPTAASLRLRRAATIGVVLTERLPYAFTDPGMVSILHGIASELSDAQNALLLVPAGSGEGETLLRAAIVDALILCSLSADDPAVGAALERHVPLVTVGNPRLPHVPCVRPDNRRAAAEVAQHLIGLGHRRFAILTSVGAGRARPRQPVFQERVDGFRNVVDAAGMDQDAVRVVHAGANSTAAGREATRALLAGPRADRPTAVFAVTDILALGVLAAARERRISVPRQLSVAGFDDIAAAATSRPGLTTVTHDLFGQGQAAARLALRAVAGAVGRAPRFDANLVVRASTGQAPSDN